MQLADQEHYFVGTDAVNMSYQQQAACNRELGRLQGVLSNFASLRSLQDEAKDLSAVESESKQDPELKQMALQERKLLEEQASHQLSLWLCISRIATVRGP